MLLLEILIDHMVIGDAHYMQMIIMMRSRSTYVIRIIPLIQFHSSTRNDRNDITPSGGRVSSSVGRKLLLRKLEQLNPYPAPGYYTALANTGKLCETFHS